MSIKPSEVFSFGQALVQDRHTLRVVAQADEINRHGAPNTTLMKWMLRDARRVDFHLDWYVGPIALTTSPTFQYFAAGPDGRCAVADLQSHHIEQIGSALSGPSVHGVIRDIRWIDGSLYATGMSRQVYRRSLQGRWDHIDQGVLLPPDTETTRGFNSIAGTRADDIVCVGFGGEIFGFDGKRWSAQDSGTNVILNRVKSFPQGMIACGQMGVLLLRRQGHWVDLLQEDTKEQIWDIEWFADRLYFATEGALYTLEAGGVAKEVEIDSKRELSFGFLHAHDGVMISSGTKDVFWTSDGKTWHELS
jgi:hypothetical protein